MPTNIKVGIATGDAVLKYVDTDTTVGSNGTRSEERRVGKECRSGRSPDHSKTRDKHRPTLDGGHQA